MSRRGLDSLFARTAALIASTILVFVLIAWAAIAWTTIIPSAQTMGRVLALRTRDAAQAYGQGHALPEGITRRVLAPGEEPPAAKESFLSLYLITLRRELRTQLPGAEVRITRISMPSEIWVHEPGALQAWWVLNWQLARAGTSLVLAGVLLAVAALVLGAAALFARRLTAPLAALAAASRSLGSGERVVLRTVTGPVEAVSLAKDFQRMADRLGALEAEREIMLAGVSHDLRSPLARLRIQVELLEAAGETQRQAMVEEIDELDRMVGQFLHYVRAGYHETVVATDFDAIVRGALARCAPGQVELAPGAAGRRLLPVESVRHVVFNLVGNALEHGAAPVRVATRLTASEAVLTVEDHGPGLSPAQWLQALRPFHRLRPSEGSGHSGLGLALCERLAQACGGKLAARQVPGGFVVELTLPAPPVPGAPGARA
ncbi:MAG: HAMP domain-containing protein [Proteobacteria bacterium]|nr:HAMP domain-containing protein [Pseudomonadota bacterium]